VATVCSKIVESKTVHSGSGLNNGRQNRAYAPSRLQLAKGDLPTWIRLFDARWHDGPLGGPA